MIKYSFEFYPARIAILCTLVLMVSVQAAHAAGPSFDCKKASGKIENALCKFPSLAELDVKLFNAYSMQRKTVSREMATVIRSEQREWVAERDKVCGTLDVLDEEGRYMSGGYDLVTCLENAYETRYSELTAKMEQRGDWELYTSVGLLFARDAASHKKVPVYLDFKRVGAGPGGGAGGFTLNHVIASDRVPYLTIKAISISQNGAFVRHDVSFKVIGLREGKSVSLTDLFKESEVLAELRKQCGQRNPRMLVCGDTASLDKLLSQAYIACSDGQRSGLSKEVLGSFTLDRVMDANQMRVTVVFADPCRQAVRVEGESEVKVELVEWPLTLTAKPGFVDSLKAGSRR